MNVLCLSEAVGGLRMVFPNLLVSPGLSNQPIRDIATAQVRGNLADEAGMEANVLEKVAELLQRDSVGIINLEVHHVMRRIELVAGGQHVHLVAQLEDFFLITETWGIHKKFSHRGSG